MRLTAALCSCLLACTQSTAAGETLHFIVSPAQASWTFDGSHSACALAQQVPDYGEAVLSKEAGRGVSFSLIAPNPWFEPGTADASSSTPEWHSDYPQTRDLGVVPVAADGTLSFDEPVASELLVDLYEGRDLEFVQMGRNGRPGIAVGISGVNFRSLYARYAECAAALWPATFEHVARSSLVFPTNDFALDAAAKERLDLIAAYVRADRHLGKIYIDGHSDGGGDGEHNLDLSRRRAEVVADYLVEQRIPNERMTIRYHADRYPIAPNTTAEGRAKNRRATVRLEREGSDDSSVATR